MTDHPSLTTPARLAERWEVNTTLIYDLLNSGELPGFKLGGKLWRIKMIDVEAYECRSSVG
ncbi:helix-turn-helix domain-containing protein [Sphingopyxis sp. MWB1]|uniref:helix-turn-helix domain-containing protein n=1 Tax=Sphingopyxis sp. MWB1 TaxID=1537715 RepID=UPI00051A4CBE|nr:helix-turn-helix domain-containing protein [Sphingopyxis sp. MWB1]